MSIRRKFTLLVVFLSALILVQALVGYWIGIKADQRLQEMYDQRTQSLAKLGAMLDDANVIRVRLLRATLAANPEAVNTELSQVDSLQENINKLWAEVKNHASSEEEKKLVNQYEATQGKFTQQRTAWIQALKSGDFEKAKTVAGDKLTTVAFRDSRNAIRNLFGIEDKLANRNFQDSRSDATKAQVTLLTIIVLSIFTAVLSGQFILKPIVLLLQEATGFAAEIAKGNLSKKIIIKGQDEIAQLMRSLDTMQTTLCESVRIIQQASEELAQQANTISENANQIHEQAAHQGDAMSSAASAIEELTVSINILSENTEEAHKTTDLAGKEAKEGENTIIATAKQMQSVADTVKKASNSIEELGSKSKQVNQIVDVIREVADQTNLLALNAAIEAARAGEQGRGFAVVADEVRKLAERTGQSTLEISKVIDEVLGETISATQEMGLGVSKVEEGTKMAEEAGHSINQIVASTDHVIGMVSDISNAIREQTTAAQDIAKSVEHVAQMADEAIAIANANNASANTLKELSRKLSSTVNRFQLE